MSVLQPALLTAAGLSRFYHQPGRWWRHGAPLRALDGVDLEVRAGEIVGIVGESGSGKSTLARLLLGLDRPSAGEVRVMGAPVADLPRRQFARWVQPVFQDPYGSLNPSHTVAQILSLPLRLHGAGAGDGEIARLLDMVGLPVRVRDSLPRMLSGGQRQRVAIARALAPRPRLLICDEPTSALDVSVQAQILNLLLTLRRELDLAIVLVSHNLGVVGHMAGRIHVMQAGRIVESGTTRQIFDRPAHDYTRELFGSILDLPGR
ncbi:ABC transporter ATP-binding protein [Brenneria corticis]|uniref:ABC transporter ATP-binding protein n=1 Tax=Brenneria corticis TaxID=2173106 RepID=A0A2U1TUF5_9GAMM|nr:ABC transporter ATP-binding protein [Brenneria sp. CFCC 11842]PWC13046.1 ABC transporter ATP-binding protein [Brenneria sp. CFCC 11842]